MVSSLPLKFTYNNQCKPIGLAEASAIGVDSVSSNTIVSGGQDLLTTIIGLNGGAGQSNTASNVSSIGSPVGWFRGKNGVDLELFTASGNNVNLNLRDDQTIEVSSWTEADIAALGSGGGAGETNTASNASSIGSPSGWFKEKDGTDLEFFTFSAVNLDISFKDGQTYEISAAQDVSAMKDTRIVSPVQGESLLYSSATEEWQNAVVTPPGTIQMYAVSSAPAGWLLCDGAAVSKATYERLFLAIGTTFNHGGEAAGEFRVPDFRGKSPVGINATTFGDGVAGTGSDLSGVELAASGGSSRHTLSEGEMPSHAHGAQSVTAYAEAGGDDAFVTGNTAATETSLSLPESPSIGDGNSHENMSPFLGICFIIKT